MSSEPSRGSQTPDIPLFSLKEFSAQARRDALILVAEDHPDSRDAIRTLLEAVGYRVATVSDGRQAVECAQRIQPDLILMDIMMPVMDGLEATRELRRSRSGRRIPILAVTAMDGADTLTEEAGCDGYVSKPIQVKEFLGKVASLLSRPSANGAPARS